MKEYLTLSNIYFFICLCLSTALAIVFSSLNTWIIWASSILGIFSSKTASEGKWTTFIFDILSYALYIYICIVEIYYGELTLSCIIILIHFFSLFQWKKNQDKDNIVKVNSLSNKEILVSSVISIVAFILYGVVLYFLGSKLPFLNAIPTIVYLLGNYFCFRRSSLQFICWILYEVFFIALWIIAAINGEIGSIIFLIGGISEFIYGIIGLIEWHKIKEKQNNVVNIHEN